MLAVADTDCGGPQNKIDHLPIVTSGAGSRVECPRSINRLQDALLFFWVCVLKLWM